MGSAPSRQVRRDICHRRPLPPFSFSISLGYFYPAFASVFTYLIVRVNDSLAQERNKKVKGDSILNGGVPLPRYQDSQALLEYAVGKMKEEGIVEGVMKWQAKEVDMIVPPEAEEVKFSLNPLPASLTACYSHWHLIVASAESCLKDSPKTGFQLSEEEAEKIQTEEFKSLIYEDDLCVGLVPSNFRENKNVSPNGINLSSFHKAKDRGLTSRLHILMLPKARRYNACTLSQQDLELLTHMDVVGRRLLLALAAADSFPAVRKELTDGESNLDRPLLRAELKAISEKVKKNELDLKTNFYLYVCILATRPLARCFSFSHLCPDRPGGGDLCPEAAESQCSEVVTAFQVYPNHSVGWLHLHVFATSGLTRAGFNYLTKSPVGFAKGVADGTMTPLEHVCTWLKTK
eukprot:763015-Hanusia_phi.AAC.2